MRDITLSFNNHFPSEEYTCFCRAVKRQDMEDAHREMINKKLELYGFDTINEEYVRANKIQISGMDKYGFVGRRHALIWAYAKTLSSGVWVNV